MKQTSSRANRYVLKEIQKRFGFMLERGYEFVAAENVPMGWQATLRKPDLVVRLYWARGEDYVSFHTDAQPPDEYFDIGSVVYAATGEKIPLVSYNDLSGELQKYIGTIETYFQGEPVKLRDRLKIAQQEYHAELISTGEEPPEVVPEAAPPKEAKRIAILYYPLMGIILLLLFGALVTLYAVLLDRLFSAFSLEADSYALFMGAGAVLLAIGTMFLLRKWGPRG